jgi:hypothetical protein
MKKLQSAIGGGSSALALQPGPDAGAIRIPEQAAAE